MQFQEIREKYNIKNYYDEEVLNEASAQRDAPVVLLMKRSAIRIFPGGERVALYTNRKLNLTLSVPYQQGKFGGGNIPGLRINEQTDLSESVLKKLNTVMDQDRETKITFRDGSETKVEPTTARNIFALYNKLNDANKIILSRQINSNAENFRNVGAFAAKQSK